MTLGENPAACSLSKKLLLPCVWQLLADGSFHYGDTLVSTIRSFSSPGLTIPGTVLGEDRHTRKQKASRDFGPFHAHHRFHLTKPTFRQVLGQPSILSDLKRISCLWSSPLAKCFYTCRWAHLILAFYFGERAEHMLWSSDLWGSFNQTTLFPSFLVDTKVDVL